MDNYSKIFDDISWTYFHNDITWCGDSKNCDNKECFRHTTNMIPEPGPNVHSYAFFKGTKDCPYYKEEKAEKITFGLDKWYCSNCGSLIDIEDIFCSNCGRKFIQSMNEYL